MGKTRYRSDAFEAIHSAAKGLHDARIIDKKTMREFDASCIEKPPEFKARDIARLRQTFNVSQSVFAVYLNTSTSTVQQWERGDKKPSGMAARLLQIIDKHGLGIFS
ncbi:DNA-binding transcriptional regulator [Cupriavidus sp. SZY C1]|uniref:helix-turn-helix domain-containing protein n=1 Tax=Cupriavidus sp. SZY C1 TaxID=3055037 RepID=UPI0028B5CEA8|nr:DNA-binding transcriptional regulator [Cupriavidus sp. SZY C1]MDT6960721.1 DNA-binding transcriptional regulator [Cupriavidus sp. SZY C1]